MHSSQSTGAKLWNLSQLRQREKHRKKKAVFSSLTLSSHGSTIAAYADQRRVDGVTSRPKALPCRESSLHWRVTTSTYLAPFKLAKRNGLRRTARMLQCLHNILGDNDNDDVSGT